MRRIAVIGGLSILGAAGVITYMALLGTTYQAGPGFETMSAINAKIKPGDLCVVHPGVQDAMPNPAVGGTATAQITYIGAAGLTDTLTRASIVCPGGTFSKAYVTLKGLTFSSRIELTESADYDSVLYCTIKGNFSNQGGDYNVYANSKWTGFSFCWNKWTLGSSTGGGVYNCDFPYLGQGQMSGDHAVLYWSASGLTEMFNRKLVTVETGVTGDASEGPVWWFDSPHYTSRGNVTRINQKQATTRTWRLRADSGPNVGSFDWHMDRDTLIVTGQAATVMPSSSASCSTDPARYLPQCVGSWDVWMDSCLVDASACTSSEVYWQGGMHGWHISDSKIKMRGPAIHAFDIDLSSVVRCSLEGTNGVAVRWTDEYSRPLWGPGDMNFCQNQVTGSISTAASLAGVPGAVVSNCSATPPGPSPSPTPAPTPPPTPTPLPSPSTAPGDTVRLNVTGPAVITVTK